MASVPTILHLHSTFDLGGKEARATRLMNAFGDRARHVIVSAVPDRYGARERIDRGIRYEIAQDAPALTGTPSVAPSLPGRRGERRTPCALLAEV